MVESGIIIYEKKTETMMSPPKPESVLKFIRAKSAIKCDALPTESNFQTRSGLIISVLLPVYVSVTVLTSAESGAVRTVTRFAMHRNGKG
ncbi:MAG: DUF6783 domain-containing protein [[Clostridium] symbiosum]